MRFKSLVICLFAVVVLRQTARGNVILDLTGSNVAPFGGTIDLSISVNNDTSDFLFEENTALNQFVGGYGTYTDLLSQADPSALTVLPRTGVVTMGAGQYAFLPSAPPGIVVQGMLTLFYALYSVNPNDPNFDPIADYVTSGQASTSANFFQQPPPGGLQGPPPSSVPEPSAGVLFATGFLLIAMAIKGRRAWRI